MERSDQLAVDHLVLPVRDLGVARSRLTALGFTVAPNGRHPFGTENACVYIADGTFLEPLAVYDKDIQHEAIQAANVFVQRDWAYRYRRGNDGFSAVVFATEDAQADHALMVGRGISAGPMLDFSRDFVDAAGKADKASFRLAFAHDPRAPDFFLFTCQRLNVPKVDRSALQVHANGVSGLRSVVVAAPQATNFCYLFNTCARTRYEDSDDASARLRTGNAAVEFLDNQRFAERFGHLASGDQGLEARAVVFGVPSLKMLGQFLDKQRIPHHTFKKRLIVDPASGQGTVFAFEVDHG